jgi:hypothetical protein
MLIAFDLRPFVSGFSTSIESTPRTSRPHHPAL